MRFNFPRTKIVATIGPASNKDKMIKKLINAGVDAFRLNMSHGSFQDFSDLIQRIRKIANENSRGVAIVLDLPGPKMRLGKLDSEINIKKGDRVVFSSELDKKTENGIFLPHTIEGLEKNVKKGSVIFVSDGMLQFKVLEIKGKKIITRAMLPGTVRSHKGINVPGLEIKGGAITEFDKSCIEFGAKNKVDVICVSFVGDKKDIETAKALLPNDPHYKPFILAKIERKVALDNIHEIIGAADAVMVARGDLGVELPIEEIPLRQKEIVHLANMEAKPVIVATQMLESMVDNLRPTRAEVTDIANAILDGADAIMFSEETAIGKHPLEVVKTAIKIAKLTEHRLLEPGSMAQQIREKIRHSKRIDDMISIATYDILSNKTVSFVVAPTTTGMTALRISRIRPRQWILAITDNYTVRNILNISFGVMPMYMGRLTLVKDEFTKFLEGEGILNSGDRIVITSGTLFGVPGSTNSLKVIDVP